MTTTIPHGLPDRLAVLDRITLGHGSHEPTDLAVDGDERACAGEVLAWLAGEPWSAHPECVSPVLIDFIIDLNDQWPVVTRQRIKPFLPRLVGTRDGQDEARGFLALDWLVRVHTPACLRLVPALTEHTDLLAAVHEVRDLDSAAAVGDALRQAGSAASAAFSAAYAPGSEAYSAAGSAALAAFSTADVAADSALTPTVAALQDSALDLLARMIDPSAVTT